MMVDHRDGVENGLAPLAMISLRLQIEDHLEQMVFSRETETAGLVEAMRYSLLAGGDRIRAVLALASAEALGHLPASVLPLALALEMIHTHSLVHDRLLALDDDQPCCDKPTVNVVFGEDVALLAGDALLAEAVALVLREQAGEPARVLAATAELMRATGLGGLIGGQ